MLEEGEFRRLFLAGSLRKPGIIFFLLIIVIVFAFLLWLGILSKSTSIFVFLVVYCVVIGTFGGVVIPNVVYRSNVRRGRIEQRTISMSSSGVSIVTKDTDTKIGWEKIRKVKQGSRFLWIIVSRKAKVVIPRHMRNCMAVK